MQSLSLVYICDKNYYLQLVTSLASLLKNKKSTTSYTIFIFYQDFNPQQIAWLKHFIQMHNCIARMRPMPLELLPELKLARHEQVLLALPQIFAQLNSDRILYLATDTLVLDDLSELVSLDFQDKVFAVVNDYHIYQKYLLRLNGSQHQTVRGFLEIIAQIKQLPLQSVLDYFNTGVILLNLAKLRTLEQLTLVPQDTSGLDFMQPSRALLNVFAQQQGGALYLAPSYNLHQDCAWQVKEFKPARDKLMVNINSLASRLGTQAVPAYLWQAPTPSSPRQAKALEASNASEQPSLTFAQEQSQQDNSLLALHATTYNRYQNQELPARAQATKPNSEQQARAQVAIDLQEKELTYQDYTPHWHEIKERLLASINYRAYRVTPNLFTYLDMSKIEEVKILHCVGSKPWHNPQANTLATTLYQFYLKYANLPLALCPN
ncbi:hypothetical protein CJP74_04020 [Psittacicella melopsittaci]|uniref:Glycosyl transferase family 8 n=1 Tax=Psittacicella melopsittaci TaxID=2028576 RepID=A0A3A1Y5X7_9GAMM|nr:glycosyltransferase [Psittacicella melopsittaci]RIY32659.1 hypothetical protein CJP74_04020 [Psittacicella melopsittaci]